MAIPFLSDVDHFGNKVSNPTLEAAKFGAAPTTPEAGHFYTKNGVLFYRSASNVEVPVHENALRQISFPAGSALSSTITGTTAELAIAPATATTPGTQSPEQYALLASAGVMGGVGSLITRGDGEDPTDIEQIRSFYIGTQSLNAAVSISTPEVTGLSATPAGFSSATSKLYVDAQIQEVLSAALRSQDFKTQGVRVATGTNIPLSSSPTIVDGVTLANGDSILLLSQINPSENGVYTVILGDDGIVRRADSNSAANLTPGATYSVESGTYAQHYFTLAAPSGFVLGTDPLTFVDVSGVNTLMAGDGLTKAGQTINVVGTPNRLLVTGDAINIAPAYDAEVDSKIAAATSALKTGVSAVNGVGAIATATDAQGVVSVSANPATATTPGTQSPEQFARVAGATNANTPGTVILRGSGGSGDPVAVRDTHIGDYVEAGLINASGINSGGSINAPRFIVSSEDAPAITEATPRYYVDAAISTATGALKTGVSAVNGIGAIATATDANGVVSVSANPATATTPGTLSADGFALLAGATNANTPGTVVLRGAGGSGGQTALDYVNVVDLVASNNISAVYVGATTISGQEIVANTLGVNGLITTPEVTGLSANPAGDSSATSKLYVEARIQEVLTAALRSQDFKTQGVKVAFDSNVALSSTFVSQDNIIVAVGESALFFGQTNSAENGVYTLTATGFVRRADSNSATNLTPGATYSVEYGFFAQHFFTLAAAQGFVLGTDPLTFVDVAGVNTVIAGDGLVKAGQTINVVGAPNQITVNADEVAIASTYAGQSSITTVGTISNPEAVWNGNAISVFSGGTGAVTPVNALTNLGAQHEITFICGDNQATEFPLFHGLNNTNPSVTGIYNGMSLGAVDFIVTNSDQINVFASLGGVPIGTGNLKITVKARSGGSESTFTVGGGGS